jgi:hypothetical protein
MVWDDENKARLRAFAALKMSAAQIAIPFGVTRNAIVGACDRHKIQLCGDGARAQRRDDRVQIKRIRETVARVEKPAKPRPIQPEPPVEPPSEARCQIMDLDSERCRWPLGSGWYCGAKPINGPYCGFHGLKSYMTVDERAKRRLVPRVFA